MYDRALMSSCTPTRSRRIFKAVGLRDVTACPDVAEFIGGAACRPPRGILEVWTSCASPLAWNSIRSGEIRACTRTQCQRAPIGPAGRARLTGTAAQRWRPAHRAAASRWRTSAHLSERRPGDSVPRVSRPQPDVLQMIRGGALAATSLVPLRWAQPRPVNPRRHAVRELAPRWDLRPRITIRSRTHRELALVERVLGNLQQSPRGGARRPCERPPRAPSRGRPRLNTAASASSARGARLARAGLSPCAEP